MPENLRDTPHSPLGGALRDYVGDTGRLMQGDRPVLAPIPSAPTAPAGPAMVMNPAGQMVPAQQGMQGQQGVWQGGPNQVQWSGGAPLIVQHFGSPGYGPSFGGQYGQPQMAQGPQGTEGVNKSELIRQYRALQAEEDELIRQGEAGEGGKSQWHRLRQNKTQRDALLNQIFADLDRQILDRAAGVSPEAQPQMDAVNQQLMDAAKHKNSVHIEKGFEMLKAKEGWFKRNFMRTALIAGGVLATAAILPTIPALAPWIASLAATGKLASLTGIAASSLGTAGAGAIVGGSVFGIGGIFRSARRVEKAANMIRLAYGPDVKIPGQTWKFTKMSFGAALLGVLSGGALAATGFDKTVVEKAALGINAAKGTAGGWIANTYSYLLSSPGVTLSCPPADSLQALWFQLEAIYKTAGGHVANLFATWPPQIPTGQQFASAGILGGTVAAGALGAVKAVKAIRRTGQGPIAGGIDIGRPVTPEETWRNAPLLTADQKAMLVRFAQEVAPGENDMRKIVRNEETDQKLMRMISGSGIKNPKVLAAAFAPLKQLR